MTPPTTRVAIGLGGNVGEPDVVLAQAAQALDSLPGTRLLRVSRFYRTPAWGVTAQADFVNAVALVETSQSPGDLLQSLLALERRFGRTRAADGSDRWGPRTLDLDILLYGTGIIDEPGLSIPHPRLHERAFALVPLLDVAPDAVIPGVGPARAALAGLDVDGIEALR